jgi:hypothetical protein
MIRFAEGQGLSKNFGFIRQVRRADFKIPHFETAAGNLILF